MTPKKNQLFKPNLSDATRARSQLEQLPNETLLHIFSLLSLSDLKTVSTVSSECRNIGQGIIFRSFRGGQTSEETLDRLQSFRNTIKHDAIENNGVLGQCVREIHLTSIQQPFQKRIQGLIIPLLSNTPKIQVLAIPGYRKLLRLFQGLLATKKLSLPYLQHLTYSNCDTYGCDMWDFLVHLPKLSQFSVTCYLVSGQLNLPQSSIGLKDITITQYGQPKFDEISCLVKGCKRLESFRYAYSDRLRGVYDPTALYEALCIHRKSLKTLMVRPPCLCNSGDLVPGPWLLGEREAKEYFRLTSLPTFDECPKYDSFEQFEALDTLGVEQCSLTREPRLPPSIQTLALFNSVYETLDLYRYLNSTVDTIYVDYNGQIFAENSTDFVHEDLCICRQQSYQRELSRTFAAIVERTK